MKLHPLYEADGEIGAVSSESTSVEGAEVAAAQTQEENTEAHDVTKQESFAKRLKESTEKALAEERSKWEQEASAKAQAARDAAFAELGYTWNGKPITTEAEYKKAKEEEAIWNQYQDKNLTEEEVAEILELRRFRQENEPILSKMSQAEQEKAEYQAFIDTFPDVKPDTIPQSVWDDVAKGTRLVDAYTRHENQILKQQLAEAQKAKEIEQKNIENAEASTGSVSGGNGGNGLPFYTKKQVDAMSREDVNRNWKAINESMKNPKFYE
jgi:hypothetical protein